MHFDFIHMVGHIYNSKSCWDKMAQFLEGTQIFTFTLQYISFNWCFYPKQLYNKCIQPWGLGLEQQESSSLQFAS